jgi:tripartite-type tricarboxylate transporter receptor subunit TctC
MSGPTARSTGRPTARPTAPLPDLPQALNTAVHRPKLHPFAALPALPTDSITHTKDPAMRFLSRPLGLMALLAAGLCAATLAGAQTEPKIPSLIRLVVPFSAGGSNDVIARAIAPTLSRKLGTTVVVENRAGAGGVIGADNVAKSPPDGSALLLTSSSMLTAAATLPKMPYDTLTAFTPVAMVAEGPMLLAVTAAGPHKTPAELVSAARSKPGGLSYGSAGVGSIAQLTTEMLADAAHTRLLHVPYKGASNALIDLAAGQIDIMVTNYSSVVSQIKSGKVRPLAVTSGKPSPAFPDLPTLASVAPGFAVDIWVGVFAPAGTPDALVQRLNREINEAANSSEVRALLDPDGSVPSPITPAAFADRVKVELAGWKRIAVEKKIVAE